MNIEEIRKTSGIETYRKTNWGTLVYNEEYVHFLEEQLVKKLHIPDVSGQSEQLCRTFAPDGATSSATKCVFCGKERYLH